MSEEGASNGESMRGFCRFNASDELKALLEKDTKDINSVDHIGNTALHIAVKSGSLECVELLIDIPDINPNLKNILDEDTPLHIAAREIDQYSYNVHGEMIELLLEHGADTSIVNKDKMTPINLVEHKDEDIKGLFEEDEEDVAVVMDTSDIANDEDDQGSEDYSSSEEDSAI